MEDQSRPADSQPANRPHDPLADYRLSPQEIADRSVAAVPPVAQPVNPTPVFRQPAAPQHSPQASPPPAPGVWPPSPSAYAPPTPQDLMGLPPAPFRSPLGQSRVLIGLLAADIAIEWLTVALVYSPGLKMEQAQICDRLSYILYIATAIFFAFYTNTLYKNLAGFNPGQLSSTTSMAPFWFFVPFLNIYKPQGVYQDIWQVSDPQIQGFDAYSMRKPPQSPLVTWWWGCFVIRNILSRAMERFADPLITLDVIAVATTIAGGLAIAVVNAVAVRQEEKNNVIEQYRSAMGVQYTPPI